MLSKKKLSPLHKKIRRYIIALISVLLAFLVYFELTVKTQLINIIISELETLAQTSINDSVQDYLLSNSDASDKLICITYDESGTVKSIKENIYYVNLAKTQISESAQKKIDDFTKNNGISTQLGSFTGLVIFTNFGPDVYIKVDSEQTVFCEFESKFESAGLNQTIHHIILNTKAQISVYNPFRINPPIVVTSSYEIAQTVIVGAVPPGYSGLLQY